METRFEIRSSQYPQDMGPWCLDKAERLVSHLASIVELVKGRDDLPDDVKEELPFHLNAVIYNATKLLSFSCGAEWSPNDPGLIRNRGFAGYQELSVKYKLL